MFKIKEIFYSLQGEGRWSGTPAIFVRFSGCNLKCPFCDTDFSGGDLYSEESLIQEIRKYLPCQFIVFTGGEPTLQLTESLLNKLRNQGYYLAMETNGTRLFPLALDWITISPKMDFLGASKLYKGNHIAQEVKVVYTGENRPEIYALLGKEKYIQPCDTGNPEKNAEILKKSVEWLKEHPGWKLSLQTQKILDIR